MQITLLAETNKTPLELASHAARVCYTLDHALIEKPIDVKGRLFDSGHHTTLQHSYFTFYIKDIPVSAVVFGLHLASPYYNTDQRSGRFSKMYENPDFEEVRAMLTPFYDTAEVERVLPWIQKGVKIYQDSFEKVKALAIEAIKKERPFANEKYLEMNGPKIAQEQLRMFISQVVPTALDYTVNLSALTALWRAAWTPELRAITDAMRDAVVAKHPELETFFNPQMRRDSDWFLPCERAEAELKTAPELTLLQMHLDERSFLNAGKDSVDTLYFTPEAMENDVHFVRLSAHVSAATYGQDQRHRSIKRSTPVLSGAFYLPPLLKQAGMEEIAQEYMQEWLDLKGEISDGLLQAVAPYGAMVKYEKLADLNALIHEEGKRSCWCAQEEIYHLAVQLKEVIRNTGKAGNLVEALAPPCLRCGRCYEGARYCGRDIKGTSRESYFPKRVI